MVLGNAVPFSHKDLPIIIAATFSEELNFQERNNDHLDFRVFSYILNITSDVSKASPTILTDIYMVL